MGYTVEKEVYVKTPLGKRFLDILVRDKAGNVIGGIEAKLGSGRYHGLQRMKDLWIQWKYGWGVTEVRG